MLPRVRAVCPRRNAARVAGMPRVQVGCFGLPGRAATRIACRLDVLDNSECKWMVRATHNSDEARFPFEKRRPARSTARRLVRGPPCVETSADQWPGKKTSARSATAFPGGEPHAEHGEPQEKCVSLDSNLAANAREVQSAVSARPPPQCIADVLKGKKVSLPPRPLCARGLIRDDLKILYSSERRADWWDVEFEVGRAPFDSKFRAVWHALFESFVPIKRRLAPVYQYLICSRRALSALTRRMSPPRVSSRRRPSSNWG